MDAYKCICSRLSVRSYLPKKIPKKIISSILTAASMAPSGLNAQPWYFVVINNEKKIEQMRQVVLNSLPESDFVKKYKTFFNAPCIVSVFLEVSKRWYHRDKIENNIDEVLTNPDYFSVAAAIENMLLAAHSFGLGSCWCHVSPEYSEELEELLDCQSNYKLVSNITLGYYKDKITKPPRKSIAEICRFIS